ncbi:hypothetical protein F2Q68_00016444 [Brassica cretica]|uniref:DUF287 domain-containing protein n=2 Tax=Brassica cretica TaxID=69181 RepID=A0A8S9HAG4_BRACR|nr:hypothetical protein F2Q68_00016444 [Brassica cretica]
MKQTQAPSTNLSPRKPSKVSEMQMKAKKMQVIKRKRRNLVVKRKTSEVEEDNEGEKEVGEEEKEAGDEEKEVGEEEKEPAEKEKEPAKEGDEMEPRRNDEEAEERTTQSVREHEAHAKELLAFEAISSLRNHFRESVNGARPDIASILVETAAEKELLESIGMGKESCWADDNDDAAVDRWTKIIQKGKKQVFFEEQFGIDFAARTAQVEGPTIPAIGGGSNNAESGHTDAYSMEAPRVEALKAMEGRHMNAISDGMKEVNKKVKLLSNRLTLVENEVKSLRVSVPRMSELLSEGEIDNSSDQDGSDNPSEEYGGDTPSEEDKDGGSKNDSVLAIANQVQGEHGNGDDDMDDTAEMSATAEKLEIEILEKTNTEKKKKKRKMEDAAQKEAAQNEAGQKEVAQKKDAKQKAGEKKQTKKAAEKEAAAEREAAAEKEAAQKKAGRKNKKPKKGGKKTL